MGTFPRGILRLRDMRQAITEIEDLLRGRSLDEMQANAVVKAAFERFLEIVSEASRGVPEEWRLQQIADRSWWRRVEDIGNVIRHSYDRVDAQLLWSTYEIELPKLKQAVDAILSMYGQSR